MVTPINKQTAKLGTTGFLAVDVCDVDLRSQFDVEYMQQPDVFLNANRLWEWINRPDEILSGTLYGGVQVYATWQDALEAGIERATREIKLDREGLAGKLRDLEQQEAHVESIRQFLSEQRAST